MRQITKLNELRTVDDSTHYSVESSNTICISPTINKEKIDRDISYTLYHAEHKSATSDVTTNVTVK